jgi:serine protease Do
VIKDGAGEEAGLKTGDVILTVDGTEVNAANQLQTVIGSRRPGDVVKLVIFRDGKNMDIQVKLKPRSDNDIANIEKENKNQEQSENPANRKFESIGLIVTELNANLKTKYDVSSGILVTDVAHFSEAFNRGMRSGFVIIEADKQSIDSISDFESILSRKSKGDVVVMKVVTQMKDIRLIAVEM